MAHRLLPLTATNQREKDDTDPEKRPMTEHPPLMSLKTAPDWAYLLREFYEMYRFLPSGGSHNII